ncbi:hypothetical protein ACF06Q_25525 [Streptomyces leeuwenhoekii]|uniref:hypothetical protein n=1 Tax=Streptomyces leeuwenhoekii TaxID=1437453 RepID=UPI0036FB8912
MALAPYRLVWLALWAQAPPERNAALAEHFRTALAPHGEVVVHARGPYPRTPEMLHFEVDLTPRHSAPACLRALGFRQDDFGWTDWERTADGGVFLHPAVYGAQAGALEAAAAPLFRTGDVVRVRDRAEARALGLVGAEVVVGHPDYDPDTAPALRTWRYSLHIEGQDDVECLDESALEPTGRRVRLYGARVGVGSGGVPTGSVGESWGPSSNGSCPERE